MPILMISGHTNYAMDGRAKNAGANLFLNKPFTISQLRSAVTHLTFQTRLALQRTNLLIKILFIALSLALDVFAVSVGVGMRGATPQERQLRIAIAFPCAEIVDELPRRCPGRR